MQFLTHIIFLLNAKAFKIALVPSADRSMDTCTVCQMRRGYDYVVMHR